VAGLGGGTGSGMFLDIGYIVRNLLRKSGFERPDVVGLFLLPTPARAGNQSPALGNCFAALTELHHFSSKEVLYQAFFDEQEEPLQDPEAPFSRCMMVPLPEEGSDARRTRDTINWTGDLLCRELVTPLGRKLDEGRADVRLAEPPEGFVCQTFGAYRFSLPRRVLLEQVGRALAQRVVHNWLTGDRLTVQQQVNVYLSEQWAKLGLPPESAIASLQSACERSLGRAVEAECEAVLQRGVGAGEVQATGVLSALGQLEQLVGRPGEAGVQTPLAQALAGATRQLRREHEQKLAELLGGLVDDPKFRLLGAEEGLRQVTVLLDDTLRAYRTMFEDLDAKAADAHTHIHALLVNLQKGSWWPGKKAKTGQELRETLQSFPRLRFQALILQQVVEVYQGARETLAKRTEELNFCRTRLTEFQRMLEGWAMAGRTHVELGPGRHFLPQGLRSVDEAIDMLLKAVKHEDLVELDGQVEGIIRKQFRSLLQLCVGVSFSPQDLLLAVLQQCEAHVDEALGKASVAALYVKDRPGDAQLTTDLTAAFDEAAPVLGGARYSGAELRFLVTPADLAGERLGKLAAAASREVEAMTAPGSDDIYFYREQPQVPLADLPQLSLMAEEVYRHMTSTGTFTPHTRMDVTEWLPAT
jgi:hypothetical protein